MKDTVNIKIDDAFVRVKLAGKYAKNQGEQTIETLSDKFKIGSRWIGVDVIGNVYLDIYPYNDFSGTRTDFDEFVEKSKYFSKYNSDSDKNYKVKFPDLNHKIIL